jgi:hypothetical protein
MPANYVLLERIELNASAASVTFSSIPQTGYTDLKIVVSARSSNTDGFTGTMTMRLNGNTGANYSFRQLFAATATPGSGNGSGQTYATMGGTVGASLTANTFNNAEIYIPNYTSSTNKSWSLDTVSENNASTDFTYQLMLNAGLWSQTAAINEVTLFSGITGSTNFVSGSTFSLYGLAALGTTPVIAPKASGGNVITTDGTYWYHTFLASGTFTPQTSLSCDVLTVAGGGAGGRGGGGAGGLVYASAQTVAASAQTITIGGGGAQRTTDGGGLSNAGSNSQFASLTAAVGGGAAAGYSVNGGTGGSGGGAGWGGGSYSGGSATSGQGNAGGSNTNGDCSGGGGGAGAAGGNGATGSPGQGGNGSSTYSSWGAATATGQNVSGTYYYAGGGSGSGNTSQSDKAGGYGGGGTGRSSSGSTPGAGTANTGGGGGGGSGSTAIAGGAGGSGIVIIRYLA